MLTLQKSGRIENLATEIASQEAQLEQIRKVYDKDVTEFKKRKLTKDSQEWKSADKAYESASRAIKRLIEVLKLCQSLPLNSVVIHEDGQGLLCGFLIDDRGVVMADVDGREIAPNQLKLVADLSGFPGNASQAGAIRERILAVKSEADSKALLTEYPQAELNWVRLNLLSKDEQKGLADRIRANPLPKPVAVGDIVCKRNGEIVGTVTHIAVRSLEIDGNKMSWSDFELMDYRKQETELPQSIQNFLERNTEEIPCEQNQVEIAETPIQPELIQRTEVEIVGSSDEDECDRICAEINELGAKFEFEVGRRLLRLTEIFKPSAEYPTLDSYCQAKLNQKFSETKRKELVHAAKVVEALPTAPITSLRQTKPLYKMLNSGVEPEVIEEIVGVAMTTPSGLTGNSIESVAVERGLLPKKEPKQSKSAKQEVVSQGRSLGLSGSESQQLPDIDPNADVPPEQLVASLAECITWLEVNDFIRARQSEAIAQFVAMNWEERFELRQLTQGTIDSQLLGNATEVQCRQVIPLLDLDKDSKIEWLTAELVRLRQENDELKLQLNGKSKPISTRTDECIAEAA